MKIHKWLVLSILGVLVVSLTSTGYLTSASAQDESATVSESTYSLDNSENDNSQQVADCPEASAFMDLSVYAGAAGTAYDDPYLEVYCTDTHIIIESNGIPHYEFIQITPNPLVAQNYHFEIPRYPQLAAQTTEIPLLGVAGVAVNGIVFYGPNEAAQPASEAFGDPIYNGIVDFCLGHTANEYHYHALSQNCLGGNNAESLVSPVIAYAPDGFPIYGPYGCADVACTQVVEFQSSWEQVGDPTTDAWNSYQYVDKSGVEYLDRCNGRIGPDGTYGYHATSSFPYIMGCYAGTPNANFVTNGNQPGFVGGGAGGGEGTPGGGGDDTSSTGSPGAGGGRPSGGGPGPRTGAATIPATSDVTPEFASTVLRDDVDANISNVVGT